jgi:hypothetical protein
MIRFCQAALIAPFLAILLPLAGCHQSTQYRVAIAGEGQQVAGAYAVEVHNSAGGVTVIAEQTMEAPVVQARSRGEGAAAEDIDAQISGSSLTVRRTPGSDPNRVVDLTVWVPATSSVTVRSEHGSATLLRVGGPISVVLGEATGHGGQIDLRTQTPITEGARLSTTAGSVFAMIPANSVGTVELQSASGQAFVRSPSGELTGGTTGHGFYTGTLNEPGPAITLLSGYGDVTLEVHSTPFRAPYWPHR